MPMMASDGFIDQAQFMRTVANTPSNLQYQLDNAVSGAIGTAAVGGLFTIAVSVAAYSANNYALVQILIERLINMGYTTATLATSTLTVTWS